MSLRAVPITLRQAQDYLASRHRHNPSVQGHKFSIGVEDAAESGLLGIVVVGRPVARKLDDGQTAEITRLCTEGRENACSFLYGAARKAAKAMGYSRVITYTLPEEGGASLRAAGFRLDCAQAGGASSDWHSRANRTAGPVGADLVGGKLRWVS